MYLLFSSLSLSNTSVFTPGIYNTQNVKNHPTEIPGVDTEVVDNDNNHPTEIPVVDNEGVDNENDGKRSYMNMNLRYVSRINYKFIHDGK